MGWIEDHNMFIIMYDVTRKSSFEEGLNYEKIIKERKKNASIVWLGNKSDLLPSDQLKLLEEKGPSDYFSSEEVDATGQGNTADKVSIFENAGDSIGCSSNDKDRKCYALSAKNDDISVFMKIIHEIVLSSKKRVFQRKVSYVRAKLRASSYALPS